MAPSHMFSYLRPHHKRNASNPSSPDVANAPASHNFSTSALQSPDSFLSSPHQQSDSPVSPFPPSLPPIPRVASQYGMPPPAPPRQTPSPERTDPSAEPASREQIYQSKGSQPPMQTVSYDSLPQSQATHRGHSKHASDDAPTGYRAAGQRPPDRSRIEGSGESYSMSAVPTLASSSNYTLYSQSQSSLNVGYNDKQTTSSKATPSTSAAQSQKPVKSRLNLRNPMSLLMRRRTGQTLDSLSDESLVTHRSQIIPAMTLPDDYDPRIRGNVVHDFSAPRPKRNFSYNDAYSNSTKDADQARHLAVSQTAPTHSKQSSRDYSPPKVEREHTPIFREHFDDALSLEASQAAIRAETLANRDFVARNSMPPPSRSPPPPPPIAKNSPPSTSRLPYLPTLPDSHVPPPESFESSMLSPVLESASPTSPASPGRTPRKRLSTKTPPSSRSRATSVTDPSFVPAGLPAHLTSKSSRFSFQISGNDSAQEKLLEERHKQKAAEKASKQARLSTNTFEDDFDDDMYDYDMDDNGFEEDIPMMGEDDFDEMDTMSPGIAAFDLSSLRLPLASPVVPYANDAEVAQTPRDAEGNAIGFALSDHFPGQPQLPPSGQHLRDPDFTTFKAKGLGLVDVENDLTKATSDLTPAATPRETDASLETISDSVAGDDLYFDDGMIEAPSPGDGEAFDERLFDDPSHPLYERPLKQPERLSIDPRSDQLKLTIPANNSTVGRPEDRGTEAGLSNYLDRSGPALIHQTSKARQQASSSPTFMNIEAYHIALADAAHKAEADGRFQRHASVDVSSRSGVEDDEEDSNSHGSQPSLIPDDSRVSQETYGFPPDYSASFVDDDYDYSDYDSALEDDPMIAAANAEALANDYEGFYGQEFGFFASAQGEAQFANGGYFGQSALGRSVSGRNAVREPNLTPITERSEYSTRNSYISLSHFRHGDQALPSPGIAQLARMSPYGFPDDDPDISLSQLMKLRRGAFGGSNGSLRSSSGTSPRNSSPVAFPQYPRGASPMTNSRTFLHDTDSDDAAGLESFNDAGYEEEDYDALDAVNAVDDDSEDDDDDEQAGYGDEAKRFHDSPTLTASQYETISSPLDSKSTGRLGAFQNTGAPPPLSLSTSFFHPMEHRASLPPSNAAHHSQPLSLASPVSTTSPITPGGAWKPSHSRKGSTADSVTYVREQDESGSDRWVLERRRTADTGEMELVGREIVEGGRI